MMEVYNILPEELEKLKNSVSFVMLRCDLEDEGLNPPTSMGYTQIDWTVPHKSYQPDRLDDQEFNTFVWIPKDMTNKTGMIIVVQSIDFEWIYDDRRVHI